MAESAPGRPRFCEVPLDEAVQRLVAHIRDFRPDIVVTHDAHGGLTGHPDHRHTHRVTVLATQAAGLEQLYPDTGPPWRPGAVHLATHPHSALPMVKGFIGGRRSVHTVPDEEVTTCLDITPWLERKVAAVLAHRTEVDRGALPGLIASLAPDDRRKLLATEWYSRWSHHASAADDG